MAIFLGSFEGIKKYLLFICVCLAGLSVSEPIEAKSKWDKWQVYENQYFKIYSNAKEKKVLSALKDLEKFRLLAEEGIEVKIPDQAPRTEVYLFASRREFLRYVFRARLGGYMAIVDGVPTIVMSASSRGGDVNTVIRHEFVHAVQAYDFNKTPKWLTEGVAEMFSTAEYHKNIALVGQPNDDRWKYLYSEINYDKIIDDDFEIPRYPRGADVYAQYWLLANYSLTHNDGEYAESLGRYLQLYRGGVPSITAFKSAYGRTPNDLAKEAMSNYRKKSYSYNRLLYLIDPEKMDLDIAPRKPNLKSLESNLLRLKLNAERIKQERKKK